MKWILHHYDFSNFAEKIRLVFGLKGIEWDSVTIPSHLPKPDYTPFTGGYRRTPSLQIGADVYCDTRLIAEVVEAAFPTPSLYPGPPRTRVLARSVADWAESRLLWPAALYVTGINADRFDLDFHLDRAVLHGKPAPDVARVKASAVKYLGQLRSELATIEDLFTAGDEFVLGERPSLADIALYCVPWFLDLIEPDHGLLEKMPATRKWMQGVAAIGHGQRTDIDVAGAFEQANEATPRACGASTVRAPEDIQIGDRVRVSPLDENSPATGTLAYVDDERISITVTSERVREVRVHFPRSGYKLSRARN